MSAEKKAAAVYTGTQKRQRSARKSPPEKQDHHSDPPVSANKNSAIIDCITFGVILAALTFTAMGQHVRNVWPIFVGYPLLSLLSTLFNHFIGGDAAWTVSTQAYINSVAFATGLCPIVGRYGSVAGIAAGMLCAALCTATSALHGGLMLYNGGFTAGVAALILLPVLEEYVRHPRNDMDHHIDLRDMITVDQTAKRKPPKKKRRFTRKKG